MEIHLTPRVLTNWSGRRISIFDCGCIRVRRAKKVLSRKFQFCTPFNFPGNLFEVNAEGGPSRTYQWYELTPPENLILQTLHAGVGLETKCLKFLSLIATSGKPFQMSFIYTSWVLLVVEMMLIKCRLAVSEMLLQSRRENHIWYIFLSLILGVESKQSQDCWKSNI